MMNGTCVLALSVEINIIKHYVASILKLCFRIRQISQRAANVNLADVCLTRVQIICPAHDVWAQSTTFTNIMGGRKRLYSVGVVANKL